MPKRNRYSTRLCSRRLPRRAHFSVLLLLLPFSPSLAYGQQLRIAAAADLQYVLNDISGQYEKQTGAKLAVTYGSSGSFFAQIQNGAPFDLFLSADLDYPQKLVE